MFTSFSLGKVVLRNTLFLTISQASNYLVPLITIPYLARVLGIEQFGLLGIASSIVAVLTTLTDWGFSLSASGGAARHAHDPVALHRLFWDTMAAKGLLGLVSLITVIGIMVSLGFSSSLSWIILAGWLQVLGNVIWAGWFLVGLEDIGPMVMRGVFGRLLTVPLTFLYVHGPSDTKTAIIIGGIGSIVAAIGSLQVAARAIRLTPVDSSLSGAWQQLCDGWQLFVSAGAIMLWNQISVAVVGAVAGPVQAGLFFGAQKLQRAGKGVVGPLSWAAYPRVNSLVQKRPDQAVQLIKRLLLVQGAISFVVFAIILAGAPYLALLLLGANYEGAVPAVRWLSGTVLLDGLNAVLCMHVMLPFGMQRLFMRIVVASGLFNLVAIAPCSYYLGATGASISILSTEFIISVLMTLAIWRAHVFTKALL